MSTITQVKLRPAVSKLLVRLHGTSGRKKNDADKNETLRQRLASINATSQSARKGWLFLLTLMAYLVVAVAKISHTDLFSDEPVKLPVSQTELGLRSFFIFAPMLFLLVYFSVCLHHAILARKARAFNQLLGTSAEKAHDVRLELSSYFFSQGLSGNETRGLLPSLFHFTNWVTLIAMPGALLLYMQVAYLAVHDPDVTTIHRCYVIVGILIVFALGRALTLNRRDERRGALSWLPSTSVACVLGFVSFFVLTIPAPAERADEYNLDRLATSIWPTKVPFDWNDQACRMSGNDRCAFWITAFFLDQPIDFVTGRSGFWSRNLVVTSIDYSGEDGAMVSVRGRDLRYATFDFSILRNIDFTSADLTGASFRNTELGDLSWGCAVKGRKTLIVKGDNSSREEYRSTDDSLCTNLTGANFTNATLRSLCFQCLTDTLFDRATLRGVDLRGITWQGARLDGADLIGSQLQGADLSNAHLDGANLYNVAAEGIVLRGASLEVADMKFGHFEGADFTNADLSGADLRGAFFAGADFSIAFLFGADFRGANIWQTTPSQLFAFSLSKLEGLRIEAPYESRLTQISSIPESDIPADRRARLTAVLSMTDRLAWKDGAEHKAWLSLTNSALQGDEREIPRYIATLACGRDSVYRAVVSRMTGYTLYGFSPDDSRLPPPRPPHITDEQIKRLSLTFGDWSQALGGTYLDDDSPDYTNALVAALSEKDCAASNKMPELLRPVVENLKKSNAAAPRP